MTQGQSFARRDAALNASRILTVPSGAAASSCVPLGLRSSEGPATITREWPKRRVVVQCNVRGRDVAGFVEQVRARIDRELSLPAGCYVASTVAGSSTWSGRDSA